jgi:cyclophilin family peptidyl-prolyl cis-trans isomerase
MIPKPLNHMMKNLKHLFCVSILISLSALAFSQAKKNAMVEIKTEYGTIVMKLYDETPLHRDNFLKLTSDSFFNGTLFHRVIKNFVIQGGDPDSRNAKPDVELGNGGPGYDIPAEFNPALYHKRGAVGAARESDSINPEKKSSGSQFYIAVGKVFTDVKLDSLEKKYNKKFTPQQREVYKTIGGTPHLDGRYTVFGEVIEGMDVVDKISIVATNKQDRPVKDIKMTVRIVKGK